MFCHGCTVKSVRDNGFCLDWPHHGLLHENMCVCSWCLYPTWLICETHFTSIRQRGCCINSRWYYLRLRRHQSLCVHLESGLIYMDLHRHNTLQIMAPSGGMKDDILYFCKTTFIFIKSYFHSHLSNVAWCLMKMLCGFVLSDTSSAKILIFTI